MFNVVDEVVVDHEPEKVYKAIVDLYDGKRNWWKPYLSSRLLSGRSSADVGAVFKVTVHGILPISFLAETAEVQPNKMLKVNYIKGAFKGDGVWQFEKTGNGTKIRFHWRTKPATFSVKLLSLFYPIGKSHSSVMRKGFRYLKNAL